MGTGISFGVLLVVDDDVEVFVDDVHILLVAITVAAATATATTAATAATTSSSIAAL
jgi:hypothetical protein